MAHRCAQKESAGRPYADKGGAHEGDRHTEYREAWPHLSGSLCFIQSVRHRPPTLSVPRRGRSSNLAASLWDQWLVAPAGRCGPAERSRSCLWSSPRRICKPTFLRNVPRMSRETRGTLAARRTLPGSLYQDGMFVGQGRTPRYSTLQKMHASISNCASIVTHTRRRPWSTHCPARHPLQPNALSSSAGSKRWGRVRRGRCRPLRPCTVPPLGKELCHRRGMRD